METKKRHRDGSALRERGRGWDFKNDFQPYTGGAHLLKGGFPLMGVWLKAFSFVLSVVLSV